MDIRSTAVALLLSGVVAACSSGDATAKTDADKADERPFETPLPLNTQPKRLALDGYSHTVGVKADGTVWVWGSSRDGEMGLGKEVDGHAQPVQIPGLTDVVEVAGGNHILALRKDGTVWSWGQNKYGQLGYETEKPFSATPKQVPGLKDIVSVAAGSQHSLALNKRGMVFSFGGNESGQLGIGVSDSEIHAAALGIYENLQAVKIYAGIDASIVISASGDVVLWGSDPSQSFANKSTSRSNYFDPIPAPKIIHVPGHVSDIATANGAIVCLLVDGSVWSIGSNQHGKLGQGDFFGHVGWVRVKNIGRITSVAASGGSFVALDSAGRVWQWGVDVKTNTVAGVRGINYENLPIRVPGIYSRSQILGRGGVSIVAEDGSVYFWNSYGRLANHGEQNTHHVSFWFPPRKSSWSWK